MSIVLTTLLLCIVANVHSANILLIPFMNTSHFLEIDGVGKPLVARGHKLFVLFDEKTSLPKGSPYQLVTYKGVEKNAFQMNTAEQHKFVEQSQTGGNLTMIFQTAYDYCIAMVSDPELFPKLQRLNLDLVILDNFFAKCFFLVPYKLGIPYVSIGTVVTAWNSRLPVLPSVVKSPVSLDLIGIRFCEETPTQSTFVRTLCRLGAFLMQEILPTLFDEEDMRKYVDFPTIQEIRENASLTLYNINFLLSESAMPKLPHVEYVGGLTTRPPKPLEPELDKWMSLAPNVVVVSFGSNIGSLPPTMATKLFEAFAQLTQYRFLFRFKAEEAKAHKVSSNVRLMDWLPQNDALGHNSTQLFVTHSGNNGQQEALYHGVPMLCFYIMGDQKSNAMRVVRRGYGKMINIHDFTAVDVVSNVTELILNKTYGQKIKKASAIFHSDKHPSERAADAVEHILKYGGDHLRPKEAYKLKWWQFYMLDVFAVIYVGFLVTLFIMYQILKCLLGRIIFRKSRQSTKAKSD